MNNFPSDLNICDSQLKGPRESSEEHVGLGTDESSEKEFERPKRTIRKPFGWEDYVHA